MKSLQDQPERKYDDTDVIRGQYNGEDEGYHNDDEDEYEDVEKELFYLSSIDNFHQ